MGVSEVSRIPNGKEFVATGVLSEFDDETKITPAAKLGKPIHRDYTPKWKNIVIMIFTHVVGLYGLYRAFTSAKLLTSIFCIVAYQLGDIGITAGAHRLWSHRAYKATWQLKLILLFIETLAFQGSVIHWSRTHRVHHKYTESDADPHDSRRGFFYSHVAWMLVDVPEEVWEKGRQIDLSDLYADKLLYFQNKYYYKIVFFITGVLPTVIPMYFWNETFINAFTLNVLRYGLSLNSIWLVNSAAHLWGYQPYDKTINARENFWVSFVATGEGWHNYHHAFPWDYKAEELGKYKANVSACFIDFFAKLGWAYDLKTVSAEMIKKRCLRTGDGTHPIWGWGDKDQSKEDYEEAVILHKREE